MTAKPYKPPDTVRAGNRATVNLDPEDLAALERIREKTHAPIAALLREAVKDWLRRQERKN